MTETALGIGIYSVPEAARMLNVGSQTVRRWLQGYEHRDANGNSQREMPLWQSQHVRDEHEDLLLGFRDLIEVRIVHALRARGISLQTIRLCIIRAREIIGYDHPFSTKQFRTDGRTIFLDITQDVSEPQLVDLKRRQFVFNRIIAPSLADLDFGTGGAERWWLLPRKRTIVADPDRAFGQPIIASAGITTARVAEAIEAEGSEAAVARIYELKPSSIRDALAYERSLITKRAA